VQSDATCAVEVFCSVLQCVAVCWQCVAVCCRVLQCVAMSCSKLLGNIVWCRVTQSVLLQFVAVCCIVLPCIAVCYYVLTSVTVSGWII